jgi:hypothetical protein
LPHLVSLILIALQQGFISHGTGFFGARRYLWDHVIVARLYRHSPGSRDTIENVCQFSSTRSSLSSSSSSLVSVARLCIWIKLCLMNKSLAAQLSFLANHEAAYVAYYH